MKRLLLFAVCCAMATPRGWSQVEYVMDNLVVSDCFGQLVDSGDGEEYSSNENLVFTVELEVDIPIVVNFLSSVCIEEDFDFLNIWDGEADSGNLLASVTGTGFVPPSVTANSGTVTLVFTSDNSLNLCGFELEWIGQAPVPVPPAITVATSPDCGATEMTFLFSETVGCTDVSLDSLEVLSGDQEAWDLAGASLNCIGDSALGLTVPFAEPITGNCSWDLILPLGLRDACDSLHAFDVPFLATLSACPIQGTWAIDGTACVGECVNVFWQPAGCLEHVTEWSAGSIGTPIPSSELPEGAATGITVCFLDADTVSLELNVEQPLNGLNEVLLFTIAAQSITFSSLLEEPICSASGDVELIISPSGGTWDGPTYFEDGTWWLDAATAGISAVSNGTDPPVQPLTYTTAEGCTLDTVASMQYIEAGLDLSTCLGGDPIALSGASNLPATWFGYSTPAGQFTPDSIGVFELIYASGGCADTLEVEVVPDQPPINLGNICQTAGWQEFPEMDAIGYWTGPGANDEGFEPESVTPGYAIWLYQLVGCNQLAEANILAIDIGMESFTSCPEQAPFFPAPDAAPAGGNWSGVGIASNGWFNPGNAPEGWGQQLIYTAPNGCPDTLIAHNITTDVASVFETCNSAPSVDLHDASISAVPWCGTWSGDWPGAGITPVVGGAGSSLGLSVSSWCDWNLHPDELAPGLYTLTFTANTCSDALQLEVFPSELNLDPVLVCSDADPLNLADEDWPLGGWWNGSGVNGATGVLTPNAASSGWQDVSWTAPGGCVDYVQVNVEAWQQAAFNGLEPIWCYQEQAWDPNLFPATGTSWTLDDEPMTDLWIASIDTGLHSLTIQWNGAACSSQDTVTFTMLPPLQVSLSVSDSTLCPGTATTAAAEVSGGRLPDVLPTWSWSHGGFEIATTTYVSDSSGYLIVTAMDGCSDPAYDSVWVEAIPAATFALDFGDTLCFGDPSSVLFTSSTPGYGLWWNGQQVDADYVNADTSQWILNGSAGNQIPWLLSHIEHGCTTGSEAIPPAYSPVSAGFSVNPGVECIAWDFLPLQLIDYSQFATSGWWTITESAPNGTETAIWSAPYTGNSTPTWTPDQPGEYTALLQIENEGGCTATDSANVCIHAPVNWFLADQFSPNGDLLNDVLVVRSEPLDAFEMMVFNRWGELVWQTVDPTDGWDGQWRNRPAPSAVYAVRLSMDFQDGTRIKTTQHVTLVR